MEIDNADAVERHRRRLVGENDTLGRPTVTYADTPVPVFVWQRKAGDMERLRWPQAYEVVQQREGMQDGHETKHLKWSQQTAGPSIVHGGGCSQETTAEITGLGFPIWQGRSSVTAGLWSPNWLAKLPWLNSDLCIEASGTPVAKTKVEKVAAQPLSNSTAHEKHRAREGMDLLE